MAGDKKSIQIRQFKAKIRASKPHFMQKVVVKRMTIKDAFNKRFHSFLTAFIPKLTPQYTKPHLILHMGNGGGSCMLRVSNPDEMVEILQNMIDTIQSEKWKEAWFDIEDISQNIIVDEKIILDEALVDINEWNKALEDVMDIQPVAKEE